MIVRTVNSVLRSRVGTVIIMLGHDAAAVAAALDAAGLHADGGRLAVTRIDDHDEGLSASLRHGVSCAVEQGSDSLLVCLGDMPLVRPQTCDRLLDGMAADAHTVACVPVLDGQRGNPVLWSRSMFGALLQLSGDRGGRLLLERHAAAVREVAVDDPGVLEDFDTPDRLMSYAML